jgi:hypothetical protein
MDADDPVFLVFRAIGAILAFGMIGVGLAIIFAPILQGACWVVCRHEQPSFPRTLWISFVHVIGFLLAFLAFGNFVVPQLRAESSLIRNGALLGFLSVMFVVWTAVTSSMVPTSFVKAFATTLIQFVAVVALSCGLGSYLWQANRSRPDNPPGGPKGNPPATGSELVDNRQAPDFELPSAVFAELPSLNRHVRDSQKKSRALNHAQNTPSRTAAENPFKQVPDTSKPSDSENPFKAVPDTSKPSDSANPFKPAEIQPGAGSMPSSVLADLQSGNLFKVRDALARLEKIAPEESRQAINAQLVLLLDNNDLATRQSAAKALATWADEETVPRLIQSLKNTDRVVCEHVMNALARVQDPKGIAALIGMLKRDRDRARDALIKVGAAAEEPVRAALKDPDMWVREDACKILKEIGTKESVKAIDNATRDKEIVVRNAAIEALRAITGSQPAKRKIRF